MSTTESPKRLAPTPDTLRELYLKSGNRCAFPGCGSALLDEEGNFVGQICHIAAAMSGGERFNPRQTNEQRRHVSNLLLMCYPHHVKTDDEKQYPVQRMRKIKQDHEKKFSDVIGTILRSITDHATLVNLIKPNSLKRMGRVLGWGLSPDDLKQTAIDIAVRSESLAKVPLNARELFEVILRRADHFAYGFGVAVAEVEHAVGIDRREMHDLLGILARYGFVHEDGETDDRGRPMIVVAQRNWPMWKDIKEFCNKADVALSELVIGLDFSVLD